MRGEIKLKTRRGAARGEVNHNLVIRVIYKEEAGPSTRGRKRSVGKTEKERGNETLDCSAVYSGGGRPTRRGTVSGLWQGGGKKSNPWGRLIN